jgi:hypothetical protein
MARLDLRVFFSAGWDAGDPARFPGTLIWPSAEESGALRFCGVEPGKLQERTLRTTIVSHGADAACVT